MEFSIIRRFEERVLGQVARLRRELCLYRIKRCKRQLRRLRRELGGGARIEPQGDGKGGGSKKRAGEKEENVVMVISDPKSKKQSSDEAATTTTTSTLQDLERFRYVPLLDRENVVVSDNMMNELVVKRHEDDVKFLRMLASAKVDIGQEAETEVAVDLGSGSESESDAGLDSESDSDAGGNAADEA